MDNSLLQRYDCVFIRDLTFSMSIGIYDFEKRDKQRVVINIKAYVEPVDTAQINGIDDVVSYEVLARRIESLALGKHYDLVETLAQEIAVLCLEYQQVQTVDICIEKPDIMENTKSVGVQIIRSKT